MSDDQFKATPPQRPAEPVPDSKHATIAEWWADKQRKPLTEEKLESMWEADTTSAEDCQSLYYFKVVARAIERAHGIT